MNAVINRNPEWLFAEPAARARRRAVILKAACGASVAVVPIALVLAFRGSFLGLLTVFVGTIVATVTGVEAYWAGEIARRGEEAVRHVAASDEIGPEGGGRAALADGIPSGRVAAP